MMKTASTRMAAFVRRTLIVSAALSLGLMALGCGDDGEAPAPTAKLVILHEVSDLGTAHVVADGSALATVKPSERTSAIEIAPGTHSVGIQIADAPEPLFEESVTFDAQLYLFAIRGKLQPGEGEEQLNFWKVDTTAPEVGANETAVEVVNLSSVTSAVDVYVGDTQVATESVPKTVSEFTTVAAGISTIKIFNGGADPSELPVSTGETSLPGAGATMILIVDGEGGAPLALDYLQIK